VNKPPFTKEKTIFLRLFIVIYFLFSSQLKFGSQIK